MKLDKTAEEIFRKLIDGVDEYRKLESESFMAVHVDKLTETRYAVAHNFKHDSGDTIPDPDVEFEVSEDGVKPMTYQDTLGYQSKPNKGLVEFCDQWMRNIADQNPQFFD